MKLLNFNTKQGIRLGLKTDGGVVDVAALRHDGLPTSLEAVLAGGAEAVAALNAAVSAASDTTLLDEASLNFAPCVPKPGKILCLGLNYRRHAEESGAAVPETPVLFSKFNNALSAHNDTIPLPSNAEHYDYEVELGVIIGKTAKYVRQEDALNYVAGYCTANDVSARDLQMRTAQWLLGKTLDKFMPLGPYLVTADEVSDPQNLWLRCWVNGDLRQDSNTADMLFGVAESISYISQYMTLEPGDVISTGTPEGVILGMSPSVWLKPGDEVIVEVQGLGRLVNLMGAE